MGDREPDAGTRTESRAERADRNFIELLQGFRVAVTGVQVLFAFLLTVPFSIGFARVDATDRRLFLAALVGAAVASVCYIAPAAQHRVLFRQGLKEAMVRRANLYGLAGAVALGVSMTAATLMVLRFLLDGPVPLILSGVVAALAMWAWFVEPALLRLSGRGGDGPQRG